MAAEWQIGRLELRFGLVWSMAVSSLRVRVMRSFLTGLTIATATAFMMHLLTMARTQDPTEQQSWHLMLAMSLVVSTAGVLSAMLTSVSQRYREIGTMKCLGALDSLVLYSVLVEAAVLGLAGAAVGVVLGSIISLLLGAASHGTRLLEFLQFQSLLGKVGLVFLVGMLLTTVGASVPAYVASRMPPVEAMRGEK